MNSVQPLPSTSLLEAYSLTYDQKTLAQSEEDPTSQTPRLHQAIAQNQTAQTIASLISTKRESLFERDSENHRLSPLSVAIIYARRDITQLLLQEPLQDPQITAMSSPDSQAPCENALFSLLKMQDAFGFTPLHHAALQQDTRTLDQLVQKVDQASQCCLQQIRCNFGGTYTDILKIVSPPSLADSTQSCSYQGSPLSREAFQKMTGAIYSRAVHIRPELLLRFHTGKEPILSVAPVLPSAFFTEEKQRQLQENEDSLTLVKEDPNIGVGCAPTKLLPKQQLIGLFAGEKTSSSRNHEIYSITFTTGQKVRNLIAYVNDGPPNCKLLEMQNFRGLPRVSVLCSLRDISAHEHLYMFYGAMHALRVKKYSLTEDMLKDCRHFFSDKNLQKTFERLSNPDEVLYCQEMLDYVITTFPVLLVLNLKNILKFQESIDFLKDPKINDFYQARFERGTEPDSFVLSEIDWFITQFPQYRDLILQFVFNQSVTSLFNMAGFALRNICTEPQSLPVREQLQMFMNLTDAIFETKENGDIFSEDDIQKYQLLPTSMQEAIKRWVIAYQKTPAIGAKQLEQLSILKERIDAL